MRSALPGVRLAIASGPANFGSDVDELVYAVDGVLKDARVLMQLYELFVQTLNRLTGHSELIDEEAPWPAQVREAMRTETAWVAGQVSAPILPQDISTITIDARVPSSDARASIQGPSGRSGSDVAPRSRGLGAPRGGAALCHPRGCTAEICRVRRPRGHATLARSRCCAQRCRTDLERSAQEKL